MLSFSKLPGEKGCCKSMTAKCMACTVGTSVDEFCRFHPKAEGCKELPGSHNIQNFHLDFNLTKIV